MGIVDVTIYRRIDIDSLNINPQNNKHIASSIETAITEVNEIMRSKVAAINGNCIQGYKIEIIKLKEEYYSNIIFLALTAIGDAVELAIQPDEERGESGIGFRAQSTH